MHSDSLGKFSSNLAFSDPQCLSSLDRLATERWDGVQVGRQAVYSGLMDESPFSIISSQPLYFLSLSPYGTQCRSGWTPPGRKLCRRKRLMAPNIIAFPLGPCTYDVHKIFGILDPPLSAFHATYQYYLSAKLAKS